MPGSAPRGRGLGLRGGRPSRPASPVGGAAAGPFHSLPKQRLFGADQASSAFTGRSAPSSSEAADRLACQPHELFAGNGHGSALAMLSCWLNSDWSTRQLSGRGCASGWQQGALIPWGPPH